MPFLVLLINYFLKKNAILSVRMMKLPRKSTQMAVLQSLIFLLTFVNQGLAILLINTHFGWKGSLESVDGDFSDFSDGWFREVAYMVVSPMIISIFTPLVSNFINFIWFEWFGLLDRSFTNRKLYMTKQDSALSYCDVHYGAEIPLFTKYPFLMNVVFIAMMYGFGIPIIQVFTLCAVCVSYIIEKIAIFWHVKKPPLFDD